MFKLDETFRNRRFTETTATPKNTFTKDSEEAAALTSWIDDCEKFRVVVYNYTVVESAAENDVFTAWKTLFRYFPEKLVGVKLRAERDDVKIFSAACAKYVKAENGGKEWRCNTSAGFRKVCEDVIIDRIDGLKNKTIETLDAERKARADARKAAKAANVQRVASLLGVTVDEAENIIKAKAKKAAYEKAKAAYTTKERDRAKRLDSAETEETTAA